MEIDLLRKMSNVWEVLERHTDSTRILEAFCEKQKGLNGKIAFWPLGLYLESLRISVLRNCKKK